MKIKYLLSSILILLFSHNIYSQQNVTLDNNKLHFIYEFILNHYLSGVDFWSSYSNTQKDYKIDSSYICLTKTEISDSMIYVLARKQFDINHIFGKRLKVINNINLLKLHTQFKVINIPVQENILIEKINFDKCKLFIQFSDIFRKDNKYYVILYGVSNYSGDFYIPENVTYEFEKCKKNGFIVFNGYVWLMGALGHSVDTMKDLMNQFRNYPCDDKPIKPKVKTKSKNDNSAFMKPIKVINPKVIDKKLDLLKK